MERLAGIKPLPAGRQAHHKLGKFSQDLLDRINTELDFVTSLFVIGSEEKIFYSLFFAGYRRQNFLI